MKDVLIAIVVLALIVGGIFFYTSGRLEEMMHPGQTKALRMWIDNEKLDKYDFGGGAKAIDAAIKGDTYCEKCDKYMEGRVRICKFCGQYID